MTVLSFPIRRNARTCWGDYRGVGRIHCMSINLHFEDLQIMDLRLGDLKFGDLKNMDLALGMKSDTPSSAPRGRAAD